SWARQLTIPSGLISAMNFSNMAHCARTSGFGSRAATQRIFFAVRHLHQLHPRDGPDQVTRWLIDAARAADVARQMSAANQPWPMSAAVRRGKCQRRAAVKRARPAVALSLRRADAQTGSPGLVRSRCTPDYRLGAALRAGGSRTL